jgi:hypothetical protein
VCKGGRGRVPESQPEVVLVILIAAIIGGFIYAAYIEFREWVKNNIREAKRNVHNRRVNEEIKNANVSR